MTIYEENAQDKDTFAIREGINCPKHQQRIRYKIERGKNVYIDLSAPIMVAQATQEERWGFFQFPSIGRADNGTLIVTWQMNADSHKAYGKKTKREYLPMISKDEGKTWYPQDTNYFCLSGEYHVNLNRGGQLQIYTPSSKSVNLYPDFPNPVGIKQDKIFYIEDSLPSDLKGVYLNYWNIDKKSKLLHGDIEDKGLLRYSIDGSMPIVWWGNIKQLADNSLLAGVYPAYYIEENNQISYSGVSFYSSYDEGNNWEIKGKIPFVPDGIAEKCGDGSYDEPAFEILKDSSLMCVMRTGSVSPMYNSFSYDKGKTWTQPKPFTPNGVKPKLKLLKNGVLVLVSGRPGIQVRFSFDGKGQKWSTPLEMIPFMNENGTYNRDVSCGYASILVLDDNSFMLAYSDFTSKDDRGRTRKAIWCRKISIKLSK